MPDVISETADPIQSAIESAVEANSEPTEEQAEAAVEVESAGTEEAATTEAEKTEAPKEEDEDAAIKALEAELVSKTPTLQRGRISVSRHQAVLTRNRNKWDEEKKSYDAKLKDVEAKYNDPAVQRKLQMISLAETDSGKFFSALKQLPGYQELLKKEFDEFAKTMPKAEAKAEAQAKVATEVPAPDVLLADGRVTYSPEQMQEVAKYITGSLTEKFSAELEKVRGEVKPVVEERRHTAELSAATERMTKKIAHAEANWEGFKEHAPAIGAYIRQPENIARGVSLEEAYIAVVPGALAKAKAEAAATAKVEATKTLQQRVPKESIRPGSTAVAKAAKEDSTTDMEAIIRASMKSANLSA